MKDKYKIILNYIKDLSVETNNPKSLLAARNNIPNYLMDVNISSKPLKNNMIEITTKLTYRDPSNNKNKTHFEILYATVITLLEKNIEKKNFRKNNFM